MRFFTSDHHFGHENIIKFVNRPFRNGAEMDEELIKRWNEKVSDEDEVYYLGDLTLGDNGIDYLMKLNGNIKIVPGGHDYRWLPYLVSADIETHGRITYLGELHSLEIEQPGQKFPLTIALCHYPLLSWDRSHYGSVHLHGHTHGTIDIIGESGDLQLPPKNQGGGKGKRLDIGVDSHDFYPVSLEEVLNILGKSNDQSP